MGSLITRDATDGGWIEWICGMGFWVGWAAEYSYKVATTDVCVDKSSMWRSGEVMDFMDW